MTEDGTTGGTRIGGGTTAMGGAAGGDRRGWRTLVTVETSLDSGVLLLCMYFAVRPWHTSNCSLDPRADPFWFCRATSSSRALHL
jgi:hypothetical protein